MGDRRKPETRSSKLETGRVHVLAGPAGSGKTERLFSIYRQAVAEGPVGSTLWLAPTTRNVRYLRSRLVGAELPGCFKPGCLTFQQFAQAVLDASSVQIRPL